MNAALVRALRAARNCMKEKNPQNSLKNKRTRGLKPRGSLVFSQKTAVRELMQFLGRRGVVLLLLRQQGIILFYTPVVSIGGFQDGES